MSWRDNYLDEESPVFLEFLDKNPEAGWDEAGEFAHQFMLDRWVGKKQFDGLTSVFCEEFDTKKGERWYVKLSDVLVKHGETENVEKLWKTFFSRIERSFKWRVRYYRDYDKKGHPALGRKPAPEELDTERKELLRVLSLFLDAAEAVSNDGAVAFIKKKIEYYQGWSLKNLGGDSVKKPACTASGSFGRREFWRLVAKAKKQGKGTSGAISDLEENLRGMSVEHVLRFSEILDELYHDLYRQDIWDVVYIVRGGCGDDAFDDFRCCAILQGKSNYFKIKKDPEKFFVTDESAKNLDLAEGLFPMMEGIYEDFTGESLKDALKRRKKLSAPEIIGKSDAELQREYPRLSNAALRGFEWVKL